MTEYDWQAYRLMIIGYYHSMDPKFIGWIDKLIEKVRDEEFRLHEVKEKCRWDGSDVPCSECPCDKTRYCS